jgi:hypothetical protein
MPRVSNNTQPLTLFRQGTEATSCSLQEDHTAGNPHRPGWLWDNSNQASPWPAEAIDWMQGPDPCRCDARFISVMDHAFTRPLDPLAIFRPPIDVCPSIQTVQDNRCDEHWFSGTDNFSDWEDFNPEMNWIFNQNHRTYSNSGLIGIVSSLKF